MSATDAFCSRCLAPLVRMITCCPVCGQPKDDTPPPKRGFQSDSGPLDIAYPGEW